MIGALYALLIAITLLAAACLVLPLWGTAWRSRRHPPALFTGLLIIAFFFTAGFGLYHVFGQAPLLPQIAERSERLRHSRQTAAALQRQAALDPDDAALWVRLGLTQLELGRYGQTAEAFRRATLLSGGAPDILLLYAKALTLQAGGAVTPDAKAAFSMVKLQSPENREARFFLIMERKQRGEEEEAYRELIRLDQETETDDPIKPALQDALRESPLPQRVPTPR